jgi:hypothetical protein
VNKVINNYCYDEQLKVNQKFYCSKQLKVNQKFYCNKQCTNKTKKRIVFSSNRESTACSRERSVQRGISSQVREMREKRKAYIGQDVYVGRPGRLPDVECSTWWFVWLYNSNKRLVTRRMFKNQRDLEIDIQSSEAKEQNSGSLSATNSLENISISSHSKNKNKEAETC